MEIIVIGGGIGGIGAGLALSGPGRNVKIIDRDASPPSVPMDELFDIWKRNGAPQIRHGHGFLARLLNLIRDRYPDLMQTLFAAGAREMKFDSTLPPSVKRRYRYKPGDEDMSVLICRRTTLEYVMREYVSKLPGVTFVSKALVRGPIIEMDSDGIYVAKGVTIETAPGAQEEMRADVLVDASGRSSKFPVWMGKYGIAPETKEEPVGILYYTRHFRLHPGQKEPEGVFGVELNFIKYVTFPGDEGNFAVTLMVPEIETYMRERVTQAAVFDRVCRAFPGSARWIDPSRAAPVTRVYGMGDLKSHWRTWTRNGKPLLKNFFAIGDSTIRTDPAYGRGCTFAVLQAHLLDEALRETGDAVARARLFESKSEKQLRPIYNFMVKLDAQSIKRAKNAQDPNYRPSLKERMAKSFAENGARPAVERDMRVRRVILRAAHMLEGPNAWLKRPDVLVRMLIMWALPKRFKQEPNEESEPMPTRDQLIELMQIE